MRNYPGLPDVSGRDMRDAFLRQVDELGIEILEQRVASIYPLGSSFAACAGTDYFEGRALILATGVHAARSLPGEQGAPGARRELLRHLRRRALPRQEDSHRVRRPLARGRGRLVSQILPRPSLSLRRSNARRPFREGSSVSSGTPTAIGGKWPCRGRLSSTGGSCRSTGSFCLRKSVSPQALLQGLETIDGHIVVDRSQRTSIAGCFAAGDCTGRPYQFAKAVGEGNVAAHSAAEYLKSAR